MTCHINLMWMMTFHFYCGFEGYTKPKRFKILSYIEFKGSIDQQLSKRIKTTNAYKYKGVSDRSPSLELEVATRYYPI